MEQLLRCIFEHFCSFGDRSNAGANAVLSNTKWAKFARSMQLVSRHLTMAELDLIYQRKIREQEALQHVPMRRHSTTTGARLSFETFCSALCELSWSKYWRMGKKMRAKQLRALGLGVVETRSGSESKATVLQSLTNENSSDTSHVTLFMIHDPDVNTTTGPGELIYCALACKVEEAQKDQQTETEIGQHSLNEWGSSTGTGTLAQQGATPLRPELTQILCTLSMATATSLCFDPFCGSGAINAALQRYFARARTRTVPTLLSEDNSNSGTSSTTSTTSNSRTSIPSLSCCRYRCQNIGSDLNSRGLFQFHTENKVMKTGVDWVVSDVYHAARMWRPAMFDAIITDPPYGLRENNKRCYTASTSTMQRVHDQREILQPMFALASRCLVRGGRLVFLFPNYPNAKDFHWAATDLRFQRFGFRLVHHCRQQWNKSSGHSLARDCLVLERI